MQSSKKCRKPIYTNVLRIDIASILPGFKLGCTPPGQKRVLASDTGRAVPQRKGNRQQRTMQPRSRLPRELTLDQQALSRGAGDVRSVAKRAKFFAFGLAAGDRDFDALEILFWTIAADEGRITIIVITVVYHVGSIAST